MKEGWFFVASALVLAAPRLASAQAPSDTALAQKRFEDGKAAFGKGDHAKALAEFEASYAAVTSPNTRLFIARCHRELGHVSTAYTEFKLAAGEAQQRIAAGDKKYVTTRDSAAIEAEELEAKVSRVVVSVPAELPTEFQVMQNGKEVPRAAWGVAVPMDAGKLEFRASGHRVQPFSKTLDLAPGVTERVEIALERVPTARLTVTFATRPTGMSVKLDGGVADADALARGLEVDPGPHAVAVATPGYESWEWKANLSDGQRENLRVELEPLPPPAPKKLPRWIFFTTAGAAVASLAVGSIVAVHGSARASKEEGKDPLVRSPDTKSSIEGEQTAATILFAAGGVLAAGSVALYFFTDWKSADTEKGEKRRTGPELSAGPGTVTLSGRF